METPISLQQRFEQLAATYYTDLKNGFGEMYERAHDKKYAYLYCRKNLFERPQFLPYESALFRLMTDLFQHHYRMDPTSAAENTFEEISWIREEADRLLENAMCGQVPPLYREIMSEENCTLQEIISKELPVRGFNNDDLLHILALYNASRLLLHNLELLFPIKELDTLHHSHHFTRSQQVLAAYFLFPEAGIIARSNADITACAELLHALTGIPYSKVKDLDIYKKLRNPLDTTGPKSTIADLQVVRKYFEKLDHQTIIANIDLEIAALTAKK